MNMVGLSSDILFNGLFGFVGVLVGGLITFVGEARFRKADATKTRRVHLIELMDNFSQIYTDILAIKQHIFAHIPENHTAEFWPLINPMISGNTEQINFSTDQISLLFTEEHTKLAAKLRALSANRNTLHKLLDHFSEKKKVLDIKMEPFSTYELGVPVAKIVINFAEQPALAKDLTEIEGVSIEIIKMVEELMSSHQSLTTTLNQAVRKIDGKNSTLAVDPNFFPINN